MIELENYIVEANHQQLFKVEHLEIKRGEVYFLMGKNGSGKSTFLRSFFENKHYYKLDGLDGNTLNPKEKARKIAYVTSKILINDFTTVEDFLKMGRYPYDNSIFSEPTVKHSLVEQAVKLLEIENIRENVLSNLSDGQQQLVAIGKALVQGSDYLFWDEPTAFLDYYNKNKIFELAMYLANEKNRGIVFVTHDLDFVFRKVNSAILFIDEKRKEMRKIHPQDYKDIDQLATALYS